MLPLCRAGKGRSPAGEPPSDARRAGAGSRNRSSRRRQDEDNDANEYRAPSKQYADVQSEVFDRYNSEKHYRSRGSSQQEDCEAGLSGRRSCRDDRDIAESSDGDRRVSRSDKARHRMQSNADHESYRGKNPSDTARRGKHRHKNDHDDDDYDDQQQNRNGHNSRDRYSNHDDNYDRQSHKRRSSDERECTRSGDKRNDGGAGSRRDRRQRYNADYDNSETNSSRYIDEHSDCDSPMSAFRADNRQSSARDSRHHSNRGDDRSSSQSQHRHNKHDHRDYDDDKRPNSYNGHDRSNSRRRRSDDSGTDLHDEDRCDTSSTTGKLVGYIHFFFPSITPKKRIVYLILRYTIHVRNPYKSFG